MAAQPKIHVVTFSPLSSTGSTAVYRAPAWRTWQPVLVAWAVAAVLVGLVVYQTQHRIEAEQHARLQHVEMMLANLSRLVEEHAANLLRSSKQTLHHLGRHYSREGARFDADRLVLLGELDGSIFRDIGVIDDQGDFRGTRLSQAAALPKSLALEDLERHRASVDTGLHISAPYYDETNRKWAIRVTQRVSDARGRFLGVALISLDLDYFNHFYDQIDVGTSGVVALNGLDGIIRARRAAARIAPGGSVALSPTLEQLKAGQSTGFSTVASPVDGVVRFLYFRRIPDFDLFVVVGFGREEVLVTLAAEREFAVRASALICALVVLLAVAFWRYHAQRLRGLRKSEDLRLRMELAVDGADLGMWEWSIVERTIHCSPRLAAMLGFQDSALSLSQTAYGAMLHEADRQSLRRALMAHLKGLTPYLDHEYPMTTHTGELRWFLVRGKVVKKNNRGGATRMLGTHLDITQTRLAQNRLRESEARFRSLTELSSDWYWEQDADFRYVRVHGDIGRQMGIDGEAMLGLTRWEIPGCMPTESTWEAHRAQLLAHQTFRNLEVWRCDADDEKRFASISGTPILDQTGAFCGYRGVGRDITAKKRAEQELRIAATAFEAQEGMLITDSQRHILRVNQGFCMITGYAPQEVIGRTPSLLSSGKHDEAFFTQLWRRVAETGTWQGEIWNRRKDGKIFPEWLTVTAVTDERGAVTHYVGAFTDLTERKAAEDEIRRLAFYDPLTLLPNRRLMLDRLDRALAACARTGRGLAVMYIDLDHFKQLNDQHGHDNGDLLLQQVARRLMACVREEDTVARQGGDEFLVLLSGLNGPEAQAHAHAFAVAAKMLALLSDPYELNGFTYTCTPSIGIALHHAGEIAPSDIVKRADAAMYSAKSAGRSRVQVFDTATL